MCERTLFHRRTHTAYVYNGRLAWYNVVLTPRICSTVKYSLEELKEEKAVEFAAEVTIRFTELEAAHDKVTPEDLWKGTKTVLLEVARETTGCVKMQNKQKWISDETFSLHSDPFLYDPKKDLACL